MSKQKIYGLSEDPWPYDFVVNSLLFFSMSDSERDAYIHSIPEKKKDKYSVPVLSDIVIQGFAENLRAGRTFDEWINDEVLETNRIEQDFEYYYGLGFMGDSEKIIENWNEIRKHSVKILNKIGWSEKSVPFVSAEKILEQYEYHDQGSGWGW